jgi:demethylmenaquinone methyltransferase/2-methoxy-6-polyprenyl-1,4-benzoquinol methylase
VPVKIERNDVQAMFSEIAPTYDRLNRLLSAGIDRLWRRAAIRALLNGLPFGTPGRLLDLATGTGDVALGIRHRLPASPKIHVAGADIAFPMLARARQKSQSGRGTLDLFQADALNLPFGDASFDGVIIAFGLRNLEDRREGLAEMARVLRPGGRLVVLEFGHPRGVFGFVYHFYFRYMLPFFGRLISGHPTAYEYLPSTVYAFPDAETLSMMMDESGFGKVANRPMTGGIVQIHTGERAGEA